MGPSTAYVMRKSGRVEAHQEGNSRYAKKQPHFCEALLNANKPNTALSAVGSCHFTISLYSVFQSYSRSNSFRPIASFSVHILLLRLFPFSCPVHLGLHPDLPSILSVTVHVVLLLSELLRDAAAACTVAASAVVPFIKHAFPHTH